MIAAPDAWNLDHARSSFLLVLAFAASSPSHASDRQDVPDRTVRTFASQVAAKASNFQWQQLWQHARSSGRFQKAGMQPRFTVPQRELPALARQVLAAPDRMVRKHTGQAALRKDFAPQVIGLVGNEPASGLCLTLGWHGLMATPHTIGLEPLEQATLSAIEPC
ncbi:hypothetical protein [Pseudomonas sp. KNUC1026]|uniref:hypothetical protein n=1 Tax=Pseudomonas sp. KNUC1026 TaxID=2893890 RepID=UPI001F19070B|nr:hypothetical protein [Pseudomonas sp. KNUC1026]UFH50705.1 hypothetical protein LN139_06050 [Pseudomonas sp. KNUC1026]